MTEKFKSSKTSTPSLDAVHWRRLKHDLFNFCLNEPHNQKEKLNQILTDLQNQRQASEAFQSREWEDFQASILESPIVTLKVKNAFHKLEALLWPQAQVSVSNEKLIEICDSLITHWQDGLIPHLEQFKEFLQDATQSELKTYLSEWYEKYPLANFKRASSLKLATEELKSILQKFPLRNSPISLANKYHNSVKQHLDQVINILNKHEIQLLSKGQSTEQTLKLKDLASIRNKLSSLTPSHSQKKLALTNTRPPKNQENTDAKYILILEDDSVWGKELFSLVQNCLEIFRRNFFSSEKLNDIIQVENYFKTLYQVIVVESTQEAQAYINNTFLLITDLSVPQVKGQESTRENGINFIKEFIQNTIRYIPLIVHSTSTEYLDQLSELRAMGIEDLHLLQKGNNDDLKNEIIKILLQANERKLYKKKQKYHLVKQGNTFQLNQISLKLAPRSKDLLEVLFNAALSSRKTLTPVEIYAQIIPLNTKIEWIDIRDERFKTYARLFPESDQILEVLNQLKAHWDAYRKDPTDHFDPIENPFYRWNRFLEKTPDVQTLLQLLRPDKLIQSIGQASPDLTFLPEREQIPAFFSPQKDWAPESEQSNDVAKWLNTLKNEIKVSCESVGKSYPVDEIFVSTKQIHSQTYRISDQVKVKTIKIERSKSSVWKILLVENSAVWASEMRRALDKYAFVSNQKFEIQHVRYVDETIEVIKNWIPDLVFLDLHLPQTKAEFDHNPDSGKEDAGYRVWKILRNHKIAPKILVTSTLSDDYLLRRMGLIQGLETRNYLLKENTLSDISWIDNFAIQLKRILTELETGALLPETQFQNALPDCLPFEVEVLHCGPKLIGKKMKDFEVSLRIKAFTPKGIIQSECTLKSDKARAFAYLLKIHQNNTFTLPEQWGQFIYLVQWEQKTDQKNTIKQRIKTLRSWINQTWPVGWMKLPDPGVQILQQLNREISLNIRDVIDSNGHLEKLK